MSVRRARSTVQKSRALLAVAWVVGLGTGPACAEYHLYWGDVHGHTSISDGKGDLDHYLTYARDTAGLDFVIVTDHDFGNAAPWRMPEAAWQLTQERVEAYTVPGQFVAIAGYEWTSQPKYWSEVGPELVSERLFPGAPRFFNHKNVYFPSPVGSIFSAKDPAYYTPELLAAAVRAAGGLIQNNHPSAGEDGRAQFAYAPWCSAVIANTEIGADVVWYEGRAYQTNMERVVRHYLNRGGKTGLVKGTDAHEGEPAARTAVLAEGLTREAIFEALRQRRNYAVSKARIALRFTIDGHQMGEEIEVTGRPRLAVDLRGTDRIAEVEIIRDGVSILRRHPRGRRARFAHVDDTFRGSSYYYLRVTQADTDQYGTPSYAWSSPIWVEKKR